MLDCAHSSGNGAFANVARLMKVALKTAKSCLGMKSIHLSHSYGLYITWSYFDIL
jgi:hypothetical protein